MDSSESPMEETSGKSAFHEAMRRTYGSLEEPQFHFVQEVFNRTPYREIMEALSSKYQIIDDTDINCEVCFTYMVQCERYLAVRLSMVAPYASIFSTGIDGFGKIESISSLADCAGEGEIEVYETLSANGFKILSMDDLKSIVKMHKDDNRTTTTVYSAFFGSDEDVFYD
ncbi:hypothetical protein OG339_12770 [Streptosporangium sp. NBC_01495]|uniref:hypothetical protein n=1 Tax=Streptosporangium sp. NBC_01495 TaxID=2903899 RepID=UPI002E3144B6|nr:hypothetical protein [Streptosporangium sp. NBC_01495]